MNLRIGAALLAGFAFAACCLPGSARASTVGYGGGCGASQAGYIAAAGHTAVPVTSYTAAALAGLDGLVIAECGGRFTTNAAINARVSNGMTLIVNDWPPQVDTATSLPGAVSVSAGSVSGFDINFPAASPLLNGPGGVLTDTTLDHPPICFIIFPGMPPFCFPSFLPPSNYGSVATASLPSGSQVLATTASSSQATAFTYAYGRGRVVYSTVLTVYPFVPGVASYSTNLFSWAVPSFTSCAAEGFGGTKLTLCRQVCESHYSGTTLNALILAWVRLYREDPPCAR